MIFDNSVQLEEHLLKKLPRFGSAPRFTPLPPEFLVPYLLLLGYSAALIVFTSTTD